MSRVIAIVPAAGLGTRMGGSAPKQFLSLNGVPLVVFTLRRLASAGLIEQFIVPTLPDEIAGLERRLAEEKLGAAVQVVAGGDTRQASVACGLEQAGPGAEIVVVHDAVRPFVQAQQVARVIAEARARGAAILGIPAIDTVKEVKRASLPEDVALISQTIPRERIVLAQTPQAFRFELLRDAFALARRDGVTASDEASLVERLGHEVFVVLGSERNIKITRPADLELAQFYLSLEQPAR